jgi:betaine-aldehyde dehydrogenase
MKVYDSHYINGQWVKASSGQTFAVHDSTTEEVIASVPQGSAAEAEQAVLAVRRLMSGHKPRWKPVVP